MTWQKIKGIPQSLKTSRKMQIWKNQQSVELEYSEEYLPLP